MACYPMFLSPLFGLYLFTSSSLPDWIAAVELYFAIALLHTHLYDSEKFNLQCIFNNECIANLLLIWISACITSFSIISHTTTCFLSRFYRLYFANSDLFQSTHLYCRYRCCSILTTKQSTKHRAIVCFHPINFLENLLSFQDSSFQLSIHFIIIKAPF